MNWKWIATGATLALLSPMAQAADTVSLDVVAGVYKVRVGNLPERTPPMAENILELVKISPARAYIRAHLEARNGDRCSIWGVADVMARTLVYRTKDNCMLTVQFGDGHVVLHDAARACQKQFCGFIGAFEGVSFPDTARRPIGYMSRLLASREYLAALAEREMTAGATASVAAPTVAATPIQGAAPTVAPMHVQARLFAYPRVSGMANAAIEAKVNALLAEKEKDDREGYADCVQGLAVIHQKPDKDAWHTAVDVTYISRHYLSMQVRHSDYCGGAYPNVDVAQPLTIDLSAGAEVDWAKVFKDSVLPADFNGGPTPALVALYRTRYAHGGDRADPQCKSFVNGSEGLDSFLIHLDAKRGLVVQPDFAHAVQACADEFAFTPDQIAKLVRDPAFLADLNATVH